MAKYDEQFKIRVAREYLRGTEGVESVASRHGLARSMVQRWAESYRLHGVAGLRRQSGSYSASFKQSILLKISREGLSDTEAANLWEFAVQTTLRSGVPSMMLGYRSVGAQAPRIKHAA